MSANGSHLSFWDTMKVTSAQELSSMTPPFNRESNIARTERGLTIAGTRITLYDVMDYLTADYPAKLIREKLCLTDAQVDAALSYIEARQAEVEAEYQEVLQIAEDNRQYWEERNREHFARLAAASKIRS